MISLEEVNAAPVGTVLCTADGYLAWRKTSQGKSGWTKQRPVAHGDGWAPTRPEESGPHVFMAITKLISREPMMLLSPNMMPNLARNPPIDRLKFIAKTYSKQPWIVIDMVQIIAHTVGADDWQERLMNSARTVGDNQFSEDFNSHIRHQFPQVVRNQAEILGQEPWPEMYSDLVQAVVECVGEMDEFKVRNAADGAFPWMAAQLSKLVKKIPKGPRDAASNRAFDAYLNADRLFLGRGTLIAQWMEAERPNLTQMSWEEVRDATANFETESEEGEIEKGEVVYEWDDGWTVQKLTSAEQLDEEGAAMQHCVGSYCQQVRKGDAEIYSLRDEKGRSHVTIEYDTRAKRVVQVKGKQNDKPKPEYQERVDEFLKEVLGTARRDPRLEPYIEMLDRLFSDNEEEENERIAQDFLNLRIDVDEAEQWASMFYSSNAPEYAEHFRDENATPEEVGSWPEIALRDTEERKSKGPINKLGWDGFVETLRIVEALNARPENVASPAQTSFELGELPRRYKASVSDVEWRSEWDNHVEVDPRERFFGEAVDWYRSSFTLDEAKEWISRGFSLEEAEAWWDDLSIDEDMAVELRRRGVTPEMIESSGVRVTSKMDALNVIDALEQRGVIKNRRRR